MLNEPHYFIGEVEYSYSYESDILNNDSLKAVKPFLSIFRFDLHNYQSRFIGQDTLTYYYSGKLNKCLSEKNDSRNYDCEDYGSAEDSVLSFRLSDTDEILFGQECQVLEFQTPHFNTRYFVSKEKHIAPETYRKHLSYNWSFYGEQCNGGLILKLEHQFKSYKMTGTATRVSEKTADFQALEVFESTILAMCNGSRHATNSGQ